MVGDKTQSLKLLYEYIQKNKDKVEHNLEYLSLCAIAGRVCYSKQVDFNDKRINEDIISYLNKLSKLSHYSVFSHLPITIKIKESDIIYYKFYNLFKVYIEPDNGSGKFKQMRMYLNLRHLLESFNLFGQGKIEDIIKFFYGDISNFKWINGKDLNFKIYKGVYYLNVKDIYDFFYITNIPTPINIHFLRHTTLNFNARSFRYTKVEKDKIPNEILYNFRERYKDKEEINISDEDVIRAYNKGIEGYDYILSKGVPTEDARFFAPFGIETNMVISGFKWDIDKTISQRKEKSAQFLTRDFAERMEAAKNGGAHIKNK